MVAALIKAEEADTFWVLFFEDRQNLFNLLLKY